MLARSTRSGQPKPERRFYRDYADAGAGSRYERAEDLGDLGDLFGDLFGQRARGGEGARTQFRMRGADVNYTLPIDFLEAVNGDKKRVDMPDGKTLDISIPAGVRDEQVIRLKGQGMPGIGGGPSGDALITVSVRPHPVFRRDGNDIKSAVPITLNEALNGGSVQVDTITGPVSLKIPKHSNTGRVLRLRGKGVQGHPKGDHLVELQVMMPPHPDAALETFLADWEGEHPYNPRHGRRKMMITETEVVARFTRLNAQVLEHWIAIGWLKPHRGDEGFLFDDADIARTHLLCDLCYDMDLRDEEMAMVLSLMDQLHSTRSLLRAMTVAVHSQPNEIREAILTRVRLHLVAPRFKLCLKGFAIPANP